MPFDGTTTDARALRRAILAETLRGDLPTGHAWDFSTYLDRKECGTVGCAIGVAQLLWPEVEFLSDGDLEDGLIERWFGLSREQVNEIFHLSGKTYPNCFYDDVTPRMVADVLDRINNVPDR